MKISEMTRIGKISDVNKEKGTARVLFEDRNNLQSDFLPILTSYAGGNKAYYVPDVGDRVLCLYTYEGRGFILGSYYAGNRVPGEADTGIEYKDGIAVKYYEDEKLLKIDGNGTLKLEIDGDVTISSVNGTVKVGDIAISQGMESGKAINIHTTENINIEGDKGIRLASKYGKVVTEEGG